MFLSSDTNSIYPKITTLETEVSTIKYIKMMNVTILPPTNPHSPLPPSLIPRVLSPPDQ